jgi:hypothetical protein
MRNLFILLISFLQVLACAQGNINQSIINKNGLSIATRFNTPIGYERLANSVNSFEYYLSNFELFPFGTLVKYFNGIPKINQQVAASVLKLRLVKKIYNNVQTL